MSAKPESAVASLRDNGGADAARPLGLPRISRTWRWWLLGGGGGLIGLTMLMAVSQQQRWFEGWFSPSDGDTPIHVVEPTTLSVTLQEEGELKAVHTNDIKVEVQGDTTIQWIVEESSFVRKGDVLVRLASKQLSEQVESEEIDLRGAEAALVEATRSLEITNSENESKVKKAEIELVVATLEEKRYLEGDYVKALQQADINIAQSYIDFNQKCDELEKSLPLREKGFVTQTKIDELIAEVEKAAMTCDMRATERRILEEYELPKNRLQKRSAVEQATEELERERQRAESRRQQAESRLTEQKQKLELRQKRYERLKEQLEKTTIVAPTDGIVQYGEGGGNFRWGGNRIAVGERVYQGQVLITLPDTSKMMAVVRIHEADRHKISEGLACLVKVPAVPGATLTGRISKIAQFADSGRSWWNPELKEHATEIVLDDTDAPLSPGDSARVEILIEEVPNVLAVPVQAVYSRGSKSFVFVRRGGGAEPVEVVLGRSSATMIEVKQGLAAGDRVLLAPGEELVARLPAAVEAPDARLKVRRAATTQSVAGSATTEPAATQPAEPQSAEPASSPPPARESRGSRRG